MSVKLFVCYELNLPLEVVDDLEQQVYTSVNGDKPGEFNVQMFIDKDNYPSLKKHLDAYGVNKTVKLYLEAKLNA